MSGRIAPEVLDELDRIAGRRLSAEEFDAYVRAPMTSAEREGIVELIDWFVRRYPTPADRLAYARRAARAARALSPR